MEYKFCGNSGLQLPKLSLGLWHNFGFLADYNEARNMIRFAFDQGITHFDIANNYGPPPGSAESVFGKILKEEFGNHRDEMVISSKAGYLMWNGPYGNGGSRKYLISSLNQSLKRTGLEYFDIFYSHRFDPQTPIEETMQALVDIVRQGKALYIGISNYPAEQEKFAMNYLKEQNVPCLIYQGRYSMFNRKPEEEIFEIAKEFGSGFIAYSPLAQGVLTDKYLNGIPEDSRAAESHGFLRTEQVRPELIEKVKGLNEMAVERGQTMAEMALAWALRDERVTSLIVGARNVKQLQDNIKALDNLSFSMDELTAIDAILDGATL
ncbi:MAG: aldo/keto reductase [Dysgonamonadaceae bacterium]|jgi:L-glyceraldehyde 3-phosphate reductase|nr:aldo/keto reductase [Dysgonamonadaceae bacterium]MDD3309602.1 aldo/keto reductase [Dysgonamonadaceae bacterium]MDD3900289.1 aldo/keto reductase [Dysgonamonadaceae bacterium]MDD4398845.1 aldo/keto reductase [Dysgonamonadaceae bacterium]MEA5082207.1 aldo/keto reductase [Dysgonamonadaceae bacterium]